MPKKIPPKKLLDFKKTVWTYYHAHKRSMPWRDDTSLYSIIVSEVMLQQTQVSRVTLKYNSWMKRFPSWRSLVKAPIKDILKEWSGLGYNRRALYLKRCAEMIATDPHSFIYTNQKTAEIFASLRKLPGIGANTAGAIMAYAFNISHPFIETNIRSAFIRFFFKDENTKIHDDEIRTILEKLLAEPDIKKNAREWYWALMDYGAYVKQEERSAKYGERTSQRSIHYIKQKPFKDSNRQLRSQILKLIINKPQTLTLIEQSFARMKTAKSVKMNVNDLLREGFLVRKGRLYVIAD